MTSSSLPCMVTRTISIDAAHRLPSHHGKCRNIHGHHYTIQAQCSGTLKDGGTEDGMVIDFSIVKEAMLTLIDEPCDHSFIVSCHDAMVLPFYFNAHPETQINHAREHGFWSGQGDNGLKIYLVPFTSTAENLARHWYELLAPYIARHSGKSARLDTVTVAETPHCSARYPSTSPV